MSSTELGYNERLFSGGLRGQIHIARFNWFQKHVAALKLPSASMIELGCFDGRLLDFVPTKVARYVGLDAGWEGGLASAQKRYAGSPTHTFMLASDPSAIKPFQDKSFNLAAAIETLEHVPPAMVDGYLAEIARVLDGHFIIEVPNEKGILFLTKYLTKKIMLGKVQPYKAREIIAATLGQMDKVERNDHKGFDYDALAAQVSRHFELLSVEAIQFSWLPVSLSFSVGIVARSKK